MRLLIVTHYFPEHGGGVEIAAGQIARRLHSRGVEIEWLASREPGAASSAPGARGMQAWNFSETHWGIPYPLWDPRALAPIIRAAKRCDVVHLHESLYTGNLMAFAAARRYRRPVLVTQHVGLVPYRNPFLRGAMHAANRLTAYSVLSRSEVVFCSRVTERYFHRLSRGTIRGEFIANGVEVGLFKPFPNERERQDARARLGWSIERPVFVFVGRFVEKKGLAVLRALVARLDRVSWVFVGWGPLDPTLWSAPNVASLGRQPPAAVAELLRAADLLVLPSVGEGLPLVLQESMACGTPIAISTETASAYPGLAEVAFSAEPNVEPFFRLLSRIADDPATLRAARGPTFMFARREWDWDQCTDRYEALLRRIGPGHSLPRYPQQTD